MNYLDKKLYLYFINNENKLALNEIEQLYKDQGLNINDYKYKTKKSVKKMLKELKKYNIYSLTKDNFAKITNILEDYELTDQGKETIDKIIKKLSIIHDINEEDEPQDKNKLTDEEIFYKFCSYYISDVESTDTYNELLDLSKEYDFNFNEMQASTIDFVEKLKISLERFSLNISYDSFTYLLTRYKQEKRKLTDKKKAEYLKILAVLSRIYNINLRDELSNDAIVEEIKTIDISEFTNPLDNYELLKQLLKERYDNGIFSIEKVKLENDISPDDNENYDNSKEQANLILRILNIFYDKLTNYAEEDLNEFFTSLITDDDIPRIDTLTEKDLYTFIVAVNNRIDKESICNKLNINITLYNFLILLLDTTNIYDDFIGINNKNIFKTTDYIPDYIIYLNTPNSKETSYFLIEYIIKCIENNLDYYLKGLNINGDNKDRTIIYSQEKDLKHKLSIIEEILNNNSDISNKFGTPIPFVTTSDKQYALSNYINDEITYINYFNDLCEVSYYRVLSKLLLNKINNDNEKNIIDSLIDLNNVSPKELPSKSIYNAYSFDEIKDTINRHIPDIINTIRLYIEEETNIEEFVKEFKKSLQYIYNVNNNLIKKEDNNIFITGGGK